MRDLVNVNWDLISKDNFIDFLKGFSKEARIDRTKMVVKTELPIIGLVMADLRRIVKEIKKTDYIKYLSHNWFDYYELTLIYCLLLDEIEEYEIFEKHIIKLSENTDNWATVDAVPYKKLRKKHGDKIFNLALRFHKMELPFQRRFGTLLMFGFIERKYIDEITNSLNQFEETNDYYVDMANAWLLCEMFIKEKELTIKYFKDHKLNKFTINKAIQKCRESFRVSDLDKQMLVKYKVI